MFIGKVVGNVVCNLKDERLEGIKLMIIKLLTPDGKEKAGYQVALDSVGISGTGDLVYLCKGKEAALPFKDYTVPTDLSVVGIIDSINLSKE